MDGSGEPPTDSGDRILWVGAALAGATAVGAVGSRHARHGHGGAAATGRSAEMRRRGSQGRWGSALLSASVLADAGLEHFRGNYQNRAMYIAPAAAAARHRTALGKGALAHPPCCLSGDDGDRRRRARLPSLQCDEAAGRRLLAQSLLRRSARRAGRAGALRHLRARGASPGTGERSR